MTNFLDLNTAFARSDHDAALGMLTQWISDPSDTTTCHIFPHLLLRSTTTRNIEEILSGYMEDTWAYDLFYTDYDQPPLLWITEETKERMETTRRERLFFSYYGKPPLLLLLLLLP